MLIQTKYLGEQEIGEENIVRFPQGLLGLENYTKYAVFNMVENAKTFCLQCLDEPRIAFILINPWEFFPDYDIQISDDELAVIGVADIEQLAIFNILTIGDATRGITANLLAPLAINLKSRDAMQIVLNEDKYSTKHALPGVEQEGEIC